MQILRKCFRRKSFQTDLNLIDIYQCIQRHTINLLKANKIMKYIIKKTTLTQSKLTYSGKLREVGELCAHNSDLCTLEFSNQIRRCRLEPGEETLPLELQRGCLLDMPS